MGGTTIITAENLNEIQDSIIALENTEKTSISGGAITGGANALVTKEVLDATSQLIMDEIPTALKNPYALTITGAASGTYDGSSAVTINIPSGGQLEANSAWNVSNNISYVAGSTSTVRIKGIGSPTANDDRVVYSTDNGGSWYSAVYIRNSTDYAYDELNDIIFSDSNYYS